MAYDWLMPGWYKVTLPLEEGGTAGQGDLLERNFNALFLADRSNKDAALFSLRDENVRKLIYYFSPVAAHIAPFLIEQFKGVPCQQPMLTDDMHLLVGHSGAREDLLLSA
jgi:hypothetical protein